jgi:hypothetical protein
MAEEKKESWLNWLAITMVIFSACATLSSFRGSSYSTRVVLSQTSAANMWAYFQAKSMKQHNFELSKDALELQQMAISDSAQAKAYRTKFTEYEGEIARYLSEKDQAMKDAKEFETAKTDFQAHGARFAMAVVYLQVAIMLSAMSALLKKKPVWLLGTLTGSVGLVYFLTGIFWK